MIKRFTFAGLCLLMFTASTWAHAGSRIHHDMVLVIEPDTSSLHAVDHIDVEGQEHLAIKPAPGLTVDNIALNGIGMAPEPEDGVYWIVLPDQGKHQVKITYGGVLDVGQASRRISPMIASGNAFLPYGIGWLANAGAEDDRVTYRLALDVPATYRAVATGSLVSESENQGRYRAIFEATTPTEPPSVFAGDFRIDEREHDELRIRTYFPADRQELASTYLDQAAGYIELFEKQIGDFPYDGFWIIAAPLPVGLGFPGATYISSQILHMPFMLTRSLAHEILHNWWANGVYVDYGEGNWSEGLTTYMADYGLAEADNADAAWEMRLGWLRDFAALPEERDQAITAFRSKGHDADQVVGYNKVAMVFHMLKHEISDQAFNAALKNFWESHKFGTAGWSDLKADFEAASGRDLDEFFEPWLTQKGAPTLTLEEAELRERDDGYELDIELKSDSKIYSLWVPIQIETANGHDERNLRLTQGTANATFKFDEKPLAIGVDQRHDLFRRLVANEAPPILRDVTLSADTLTVVAVNGSEQAAKIAKDLAARTLDTGLRLASAGDEAMAEAPLMLVGLSGELAPLLADIGIDAVPVTLAGRGTARSWVAARDNAPPALVVEADDEESLRALLRPLPHYGRQSFLVFDGRRAIDKGVWPTSDNALTKRFD